MSEHKFVTPREAAIMGYEEVIGKKFEPSSPPPAPTHAGEHSPDCDCEQCFTEFQEFCQAFKEDLLRHAFKQDKELADLRQKLGESEAKAQWVDKWQTKLQYSLEADDLHSSSLAVGELRAILQKGQ